VPLSKISIKRFRCFEEINLDLSPGVNFFYGTNGSGKTSILESIFIFSSGKSFKSSNLSSLINFNFDNFSLKAFDTARGYIVEINKDRNKPISVQLNNSKITTSKLIREFPCSPIHNNTFSLLTHLQTLEENFLIDQYSLLMIFFQALGFHFIDP